ncbi:MAG: DNA polymerase I [Vampirovibrionales bacterium]|nr:DNA polymerase I [Vampirovibrionales bacterium]
MNTETQRELLTPPAQLPQSQILESSKTGTPKIVLIDGHALAYRMYFALERTGMKTSRQEPTWAVYGFFNALFAMLKEVAPTGVAVAFDVSRESFRTDLYEAYKAHREAMPDAMKVQMAMILEGVNALGMPLFQVSGVEADDVIGTLAKQLAQQHQAEVLILTGDQDAFQLVHDVDNTTHAGQIQVLIPSRTPREGLKRYGEAAVFEKLGVKPEQVVDYKALRGDTSDNIPGVPGIGEKTACKLLTEYPTLDAIYNAIDQIKPDKLREKLITHKAQAYLSQTLAQIKCDVPEATTTLEALELHIPVWQHWVDFLKKCEFRTFLQQSPQLLKPFTQESISPQTPNAANATAADAPAQSASNPNSPELLASGTQAQNSASAEATLQHQLLAFSSAPTAPFSPPFKLVTTEPDLDAFLARAKAQGVLAIDLETTGLDPLTIQPVGYALGWSKALSKTGYTPKNPLQLACLPCQPVALHVNPQATELSATPDSPTPETDRLEIVYVPVGHVADETNDETSGKTPQLTPKTVLQKLAPLLADPYIIKIAHNAKYERSVLNEWGLQQAEAINPENPSPKNINPDLCQGLWFDTMLASYVLNPERRHGLKALGSDLLGLILQDITTLIGSGKKQILFSQVPIAQGAPYAASDVYVTLALAESFATELAQQANAGLNALLYELELPLVEVLSAIERLGITIDTSYLAELSQQLGEQLTQLEAEVHALAGLPFNLNSPKQVGEILFERMGIKPTKKTAGKTGFSTDAQVLEQLAPEYPMVGKLLEYRQLFKLKSTYIDALPQLVHPKSGRVHTSLNQTIAATGRLSSSEPNLQNIPVKTEVGQKIRHAFIPSGKGVRGRERTPHQDGLLDANQPYFLISADYSQIELRLLAHFSEDPHLIEAFQNGQDVHVSTASLVFDVPLADVTKTMRYQAKTVNFGVIYGQTAHGLSQQLGVPRFEAQAFIDKYFERYPRVRDFIEETKALAHGQGYVETLYGRRRWLKEALESPVRHIREFAERAAFNTPLQGSAADLIKLAMNRLHEKLHETQSPARLLLQVHDELVLEAPQAALDDVTKQVLWAMKLDDAQKPLRVPLIVDVSVGPSWLEV